jgi:hypothetical protein
MPRSNTTHTTRRAVLAGVPLAAATLTPAVAAALSGLATSGADPDPIFAAIAEHRAACRAWQEASRKDGAEGRYNKVTEDASNGAMAHEGEVLTVLLACQPTTLAGVAALLEHLNQPEFLIEYEKNQTGETVLSGAFGCNDGNPLQFPGSLAATVRSLIGAGARAVRSAPVEPDPIYAAIERHRAAHAEFSDQCSELDDENTPEADAEWDRLSDAASVALGEVLKPETIGGAVAAMRYVASPIPGVAIESFPGLLHKLADALAAIEERSQS